jgi:dihydrofolate reductase
MSKLVVTNNITLDGVMQAPGAPDEDPRGGFPYGGWAAPYMDEVMGREMGKRMARGGRLLFGRRTYEQFYSYWPTAPQPNPFTDVLNNTQKYVASTTLTEPLPWQNSTLLRGDVADAVARLKEESDTDIGILGSGVLIESLIRHDLIDEYVLLIYPLVLGIGRRLFPPGSGFPLRLVSSVTTTTGVVIATYQPDKDRDIAGRSRT